MASYIKDGQVVKMTQEEEASFNERFNRGRNIREAAAQPVSRSGGGGKGGKPSIDPRTEANQKIIRDSQNDGGYGYYTNMGRYVPFSVDIRDGGGMNTSGNFFKGAGPISTALNVAKVRPAGPASEKIDGNYVIPREQIGFRDVADTADRGGPQASGGQYEGAGTVSAIFNMLDALGGATIPERQAYVYDENGNFVPRKVTLLGG